MEPLGEKLRRQRRRLGLTLDELAVPQHRFQAVSLADQRRRVPNPPSDEKLYSPRTMLGFNKGELIAQAHLQRTPHDIRDMLQKLLSDRRALETGETARRVPSILMPRISPASCTKWSSRAPPTFSASTPGAVPIINKVSAGYPKEFTDLADPRGIADAYLTCPDLSDPDAFAARVCGDSMMPKYREADVVVFSPALFSCPAVATIASSDSKMARPPSKAPFSKTRRTGNPSSASSLRNEKYRPQTVPSEKITGLYKALYKFDASSPNKPVAANSASPSLFALVSRVTQWPAGI